MIRALTAATSTIPIVISAGQDPVREGFVTSLSRPTGNVTGFSILGLELFGKRLQFLSELAGKPRRVAVLSRAGGDEGYLAALFEEAARAAQSIGFEWKDFRVGGSGDFEPVFSQISADGFDAIYVVPSPLARRNGSLVAELALRYRLRSASDFEEQAKEGLLMTLGADTSRVFEIGADYVDRILRGRRPSELPILQPTDFRLVVNWATARALGISIPVAIQERADRIID